MLDDKLRSRLDECHQRLIAEGDALTSDQLEQYLKTFRSHFGPEVLAELDGEPLLELMHAMTAEGLPYWLEFKNDDEFRTKHFGSIAGGSSFKFGIFRRKATGNWQTGTGRAPKDITVEEAITIAHNHRDQVLRGVALLEELPESPSDEDCHSLQSQMEQLAPDVSDSAWGHKYFSLAFPDKLDNYHNPEWGRFQIRRLLQLPPQLKGRYVWAGRFAAIAKELDVSLHTLTSILDHWEGGKYRYWRVGTTGGESPTVSFWPMMQEHNCMAIGGGEIGDLSWVESNKDSRAELMELVDKTYSSTKSSSTKWCNQLTNFVVSAEEGDVVVAAAGKTILGLGRISGDYAFVPEFDFPHQRKVDWIQFAEWKFPKTEGLQSTFRELKKFDENIVEIERRIQDSDMPPVQLEFWWVNQGQTFAQERDGGFVWAPQKNKKDHTYSHWVNVSRIKQGDVVFHYAKGNIVAVSVARSDGREEDKPESLSSEGWTEAGWLAECDYCVLETPIPLQQVAKPIQKLALNNSPINTKAMVNQGYLYELTKNAAEIIAGHLDLDSLPEDIQHRLRPLIATRWDAFVYWAQRLYDNPESRSEERDYKFEIEQKLVAARDSLLDEERDDWFDLLHKAFGGSNNLTFFISHSKFLDWCKEPETTASAAEALKVLFDSSIELEEAVSRFCDQFPENVVQGVGTRANLASFISMGRDAKACPPFKSTVFEAGCKWTAFPVSQKPDERQVISDFLSFLDRFVQEAAQRGLQLEDRLDAQSALWCVLNYAPPDDWSETDQQALLDFREGKTVPPPVTGLGAIADELLLPVESLEEIEQLLEWKRQVIFYGPPGTGKTYVAQELAKHFAGENGGFRLVQFHPSYTYEDFVEGYRPARLENGQPGFEIVEGPLKRIAREAMANPDEQFVLLIDEINRGNIAKVFGELYFLLEYRDEVVQLQYSPNTNFTLPSNLRLIGTMNTADRSIALMDSALRRRFFFSPFFPSEPPIEGLLRRWLRRHKPEMEWVADVVDSANEQLDDRHAAIGPSHFMNPKLDDEWTSRIWKHSVLPYLAEQFFGEEDRLADFSLDKLKAGSPTEDDESEDDADPEAD